MVSVLMLRSGLFGPATAWAGIGAFGVDLARVVVNAFARGNPADILMAIAGPLYLVWFALVGRRLLGSGRPRGARSRPERVSPPETEEGSRSTTRQRALDAAGSRSTISSFSRSQKSFFLRGSFGCHHHGNGVGEAGFDAAVGRLAGCADRRASCPCVP